MQTRSHRSYVQISPPDAVRFVGFRFAAVPARERAEQLLARGDEVVFDFSGLEVTQSFVDELVGHLILRDGPDLVERIIFKNCSDDTRAIIELVVADRADQYLKTHSH